MTDETDAAAESDTVQGMTRDELRAIIASLALKQVELASLLGVDGRSVRRWIEGTRHVPETTARLLRCANAGEIKLTDLAKHSTTRG